MDIQINKEALEGFAREAGARFVVLYGSHAIGRAQEESDIDVAVFFERDRVPETFSPYVEVMQKLTKVFRSGAGEVDFVILNRANILLRYEITAKGKLLVGDADAYAQYRAFAFRDYLDAKPLFALEDFLIGKRQALIRRLSAVH